MKTRRRPLTMRILRGMLTALSAAEAGDAGDLCGYDTSESRKKHKAACDAWRWVQDEIERREARKAKRSG